MRRSGTLWAFALLITLISAVYQRMTGPSYPVRGRTMLAAGEVKYRLPRSQGDGDAEVRIPAPSSGVSGEVVWKRYKTKDAWSRMEMAREGNDLVGRLPYQPPAGKLMYRVVLKEGMERISIGGEPVVIRFKGEVPLPVLIVHVICMFGGMLFSTRAALEAFSVSPDYSKLILVTVILLTVGGLLLGPVVQKYAFDAYWTGWPYGSDLTDNKTAVAWLAWVAAGWRNRRDPKGWKWVVAASVITFAVFAIPHSVLGSELKYDN